VYAAGTARLSLTTTDEQGCVVGLLEDDGELQGRIVRLVSSTSSVTREAILDGLGNFELEDVPEGTYALEVELSDGLAVVEPLQVH
jgi:hypothetical protein